MSGCYTVFLYMNVVEPRPASTVVLLRPSATRFASAVADLQTVLGDHQDTVLAEAWLRHSMEGNPEECPTVRQLISLEQERRIALRAQWPAIWRKANARKLHTWV